MILDLTSLRFDWYLWLLTLPITSNSIYFREYSEIIQTRNIQCDAIQDATNNGNNGNNGTNNESGKSKCFPSWLMPENIQGEFCQYSCLIFGIPIHKLTA